MAITDTSEPALADRSDIDRAHTTFCERIRSGVSIDDAADACGYPLHPPEGRADFYVYALVDPRNSRVFYIGKGKGLRCFQHEKQAIRRRGAGGRKIAHIWAMLAERLRPRIVIIASGMMEMDALRFERSTIQKIGYSALLNEMPVNIRPKTILEWCFDKIRALRDFDEWCEAEKPDELATQIYWLVRAGLFDITRALIEEHENGKRAA